MFLTLDPLYHQNGLKWQVLNRKFKDYNFVSKITIWKWICEKFETRNDIQKLSEKQKYQDFFSNKPKVSKMESAQACRVKNQNQN